MLTFTVAIRVRYSLCLSVSSLRTELETFTSFYSIQGPAQMCCNQHLMFPFGLRTATRVKEGL